MFVVPAIWLELRAPHSLIPNMTCSVHVVPVPCDPNDHCKHGLIPSGFDYSVTFNC